MSNILTATIGTLATVTTLPLWQYDYGQILQIEGVDLPEAYEVHFSNYLRSGTTITQIGDEDGVSIPDELLQTGMYIYAFVYLHTGDDDGETEYCIQIPVNSRSEPSDDEPSEVEQSAITQAIAALNLAVEETAADVEAAAASAEAAATSAEEAAASAEAAATSEANAATSEANAATSEANAAESESNAATSESNAEASALVSEGYAVGTQDGTAVSSGSTYFNNNSKYYSEVAQEAAATAGYLYFYIDEGKLYMERTENTEVTFYLEDGKLYVTEAA